MSLTQRQEIVLKTIIEQFIDKAEPIGSKALLDKLGFPVSSATIRNEMFILEGEGYLEKNHVSSGRIPSQKGYRYYVEKLMKIDLEETVEKSLRSLFAERQYSAAEAVNAACSILSEMTNLTSVAIGPSQQESLLHIKLLAVDERKAVGVIVTSSGHAQNRLFCFDEPINQKDLQASTDLLNQNLVGIPLENVVDKLQEIKPLITAKVTGWEVLFDCFVSGFMHFASTGAKVYGRSNMLVQPEFSDIQKLRQLMRILENESMFRAWTNQSSNQIVPLDKQCELIQIGDCSVVRSYLTFAGHDQGQMMVVGPSRMPYQKVIALLEAITGIFEDVFQEAEGGSESEKYEKDSKNT